MSQLTIGQYALLSYIKDGGLAASTSISPMLHDLLAKGLVKVDNGKYHVVKGRTYSYRGNTYTL